MDNAWQKGRILSRWNVPAQQTLSERVSARHRASANSLLGLVTLAWITTACSSFTPTAALRPAPSPAPEPLILYNWPQDLPQSVLDDFTAEFGIPVQYETYASMEEAVAKLEAGAVYDVVNLDNRFIPALMRAGRLAELDHARLPNLKYLSPNFRDLVYDPGNRYTVPYNWGTTGLVVRTDRVARPVTRWADLWDPDLAGQVALWDTEPREVLGLTLKTLGYSANSEDPRELQAALERLLALKPHARWLGADADGLVAGLTSGEVRVGMGYAGDYRQARETLPAIAYVLPAEGALLWGENFVVPANSPHRAAAERFLNFVLRPQVAAQIANENFYATPNEAALAYIEPALLHDPVVFPPNDLLQQAEIVLPLSPAGQALYDRAWAAFQAASAP